VLPRLEVELFLRKKRQHGGACLRQAWLAG
jgi:hypothetical protein